MRISWVHRVTKEEAFRRTGEKRCLWKNLVKRRDELIEHLLRHERIPKTIFEGTIEGKNYSRRPRLAYIRHVMKDVGSTTYVEIKRLKEEHNGEMLQTNSRTEDEKKNNVNKKFHNEITLVSSYYLTAS